MEWTQISEEVFFSMAVFFFSFNISNMADLFLLPRTRYENENGIVDRSYGGAQNIRGVSASENVCRIWGNH